MLNSKCNRKLPEKVNKAAGIYEYILCFLSVGLSFQFRSINCRNFYKICHKELLNNEVIFYNIEYRKRHIV